MPWVSWPLASLVGHRGVTHSLIAVAACGGLAVTIGAAVLPLVIGYLSHLLADGLTNSGVPLMYPRKDRFSLRLFDTGSASEFGFVAGVLFLLGILCRI